MHVIHKLRRYFGLLRQNSNVIHRRTRVIDIRPTYHKSFGINYFLFLPKDNRLQHKNKNKEKVLIMLFFIRIKY